MEKLYILDASGYLYRSYFAIRQMTNTQGESTNALYGFIRCILKLIKDFEPTHMVAVFDGPSNTHARTSIYPDYKAHRKEMPKDLLYQISWAQQFCQFMGIPELMVPYVEADDTMGSVAKWATCKGAIAYLCTSDKDMCQLVEENILILNSFKDNQILDTQGVLKQFGVAPNQMIDFLAITGDASDNVPGLSGFGPKTAADLLQRFGNLDYLLEHPTEVTGRKKQETLVQEREKVLMSRRLVTIDLNVPFIKEELFFKLGRPAFVSLREFYSHMSFASLLRELETQVNSNKHVIEFKENVSYHLVDDLKSLQTLIQMLLNKEMICLDTETTHILPMHAELVGIGLGVEPQEAWYIPVNGSLGIESVISHLKPLFENPNIGFYGHNLKYDYHILLNHDITIANICFDTILASYLLNSHSRQHSLDYLSLELFDKIKTPIQELIGKGKNQISMNQVPIDKVCAYCCEDVDYTIRLKKTLTPQLYERGLDNLFYQLELPLLSTLARMERHGIFIDTDYLHLLSIELGHDIVNHAEEIYV